MARDAPIIIVPRPLSGPTPTFTAILRRRHDQLRLEFEFYNLVLDTSAPASPVLVRKNANQAAHVVVVFCPQHVMEQALYEVDEKASKNVKPLDPDIIEPTQHDPLIEPPLGARLADPSRLAFRLPDEVLSIPFTEAGLLDWNGWIPNVAPTARASGAIQPFRQGEAKPKLEAPGKLETAIELPWWLIISPHVHTGWNHRPDPVTHGGRTELWHTRLGGRSASGTVDETDTARMTIRAIWARDPNFQKYLNNPDGNKPADGENFAQHPIGMPFRTPLSPRDRYDLVTSMSRWPHGINPSRYVPKPADVHRLMLTSLGGWLDARGWWDTEGTDGSGTSLQSWRHLATMGRDHYVRIVRSGFDFPKTPGLSLIKVTERKFRTREGRRIAYLFQRYYIVTRRPEAVLGDSIHRAKGRAFPFTRLRITTLVTPTLDQPGQSPHDPPGFGPTEVFVPRIGGKPFLFHMIGTDRVGRTHDFEAPVLFVDSELASDPDAMKPLHDWYNKLDPDAPERAIQLHGAQVAVAPVVPGEAPGATDIEIGRFTLGAEFPATGAPPNVDSVPGTTLKAMGRPAFFPTMWEAQVRLAAAEAALGGALPNKPTVVLDQRYIDFDFAGAGKGEIFVRLKDKNNPTPLQFGGGSNQAGDRTGGVITPNLAITALSRRTGTVGGNPDKYQAGDFDPKDFFGSLAANLLGDITLEDVIGPISGDLFDLSDPTKRDRIMQLTTRETPTAIVTELRWRPLLKNFPPGVPDPLFVASLGVAATLDLTATITTPKSAPKDSSVVVVGDLRNFQIALLTGPKFLTIEFDRLQFRSASGKSTDVDVVIRQVVFGGPLEFVNQLKDYLTFSAGGFSIEVVPTHVLAGFQIPLPSITVGVFALQNISFSAGAMIPFTGKPVRFRFGFSTMENPFLLSVLIFGGGGFFQIGIGPDGVEELQLSLEFGIVAAIDFGVASGSIRITAGIYMAIGVASQQNPEGQLELTGFIMLKGQAEVLGIITVTLIMKASITYIPDTKRAICRAVVIVEIDVLIFSGSVEVEYEKKFGGSGGSGDPPFGQTLSPADWQTYVAAFAPIGA
jgi:hypothetical protein